ncbi:hypothetical protein XZ45_04565 [Salmonella enterica subsp. enterica]|uniref:Uncharacterized protein n=1 Tax=Salmonella enterica TaxID=28901 RepID=A0A742TSM2_SALER|nr:hypothetical protein [Salmonella enterica subsp. enterica serovar Typhimurium]EBC7198160.1 hypothetical protein [Salmonella enterica]ECA6118767.1 hypothetical protein [Salmonella enterica subsp. enterica serovar Redlands]ECE0382322.1 hypothetical protein [Salmonella enterica subsp. enterica serovar Aba]ECE8271493.1 hypothetical protein [Salmonella enterica subsp. enterica serovar Berkeley]ECF6093165.1 hypothetical protein [Salmonella enterica subsp. salamae]ECU1104815.1 hypothetical protei
MLTMSTFLITFMEVLIKNPLNGGFFYVHVCYSPRDTALRSIPGLKQFVGKNSIAFFTNESPDFAYKMCQFPNLVTSRPYASQSGT